MRRTSMGGQWSCLCCLCLQRVRERTGLRTGMEERSATLQITAPAGWSYARYAYWTYVRGCSWAPTLCGDSERCGGRVRIVQSSVPSAIRVQASAPWRQETSKQGSTSNYRQVEHAATMTVRLCTESYVVDPAHLAYACGFQTLTDPNGPTERDSRVRPRHAELLRRIQRRSQPKGLRRRES